MDTGATWTPRRRTSRPARRSGTDPRPRTSSSRRSATPGAPRPRRGHRPWSAGRAREGGGRLSRARPRRVSHDGRGVPRVAPTPCVATCATSTSFVAGSFDAVVAAWMLYRVFPLQDPLAEFARVLTPGGTLVAVTSGRDRLAGPGHSPVSSAPSHRSVAGAGRHPDPLRRHAGAPRLKFRGPLPRSGDSGPVPRERRRRRRGGAAARQRAAAVHRRGDHRLHRTHSWLIDVPGPAAVATGSRSSRRVTATASARALGIATSTSESSESRRRCRPRSREHGRECTTRRLTMDNEHQHCDKSRQGFLTGRDQVVPSEYCVQNRVNGPNSPGPVGLHFALSLVVLPHRRRGKARESPSVGDPTDNKGVENDFDLPAAQAPSGRG